MKTMSSVDDENSSTSTSSSSVTMAKPVFLRASMLRPSAFSAQSFSSKPATEAAEVPVIEPVGTPDNTAEVPTQPTAGDEQKLGTAEQEKPTEDPLSLLTKSNGLAKSNPFNAVQVTPLSNSSGFVFGQNTRDRVTGNVEDEDAAAAGSNGDLSFSASAGPSTNSSGTPEEPGSADASSSDKEKGDAASGKSLSDVAREYEENKNARKRKFEEVETFTGEEDEINVLDVTCKLYTFTQVYEERGRGSLRLNDPKHGTDSRLVFRTAGSLRVLLNTKIWEGMIAEPASPKSLRITAIDTTGQVKVYLVMARPSDIQSLAMALKLRISAEKARVVKSGDGLAEEEKSKMDSETNGSWDAGEDMENSKVTPDLIADAEQKNDAEAEEEEELENLIVEVPALKKRALDPDAPGDANETSAETTPATAMDDQAN